MQENQLKIGDAFWGYIQGDLHVFRKLKAGIFIASGWEDTIAFEKIKFIELIKKPNND